MWATMRSPQDTPEWPSGTSNHGAALVLETRLPHDWFRLNCSMVWYRTCILYTLFINFVLFVLWNQEDLARFAVFCRELKCLGIYISNWVPRHRSKYMLPEIGYHFSDRCRRCRRCSCDCCVETCSYVLQPYHIL